MINGQVDSINESDTDKRNRFIEGYNRCMRIAFEEDEREEMELLRGMVQAVRKEKGYDG